MFSISSAPAKQSVGDTITVLSGRLGSATLLEDRRAAILGLRSFAKDFPASVASGALRSLIGCLAKDGEDVDTIKVVLETLLMLFSPNEHSPEASDEIALWLADEFTQRQENITLLLNFLDSSDFYSRLYSLQLLGAILSARTERTEECVLTAPLGISRLVAILDDQREAIRNEGISLLISLTPTSVEIQKLVAFENAFERIFTIIVADGSLSEGGRTVEECLILLSNLLRRNVSNQSLFRESGCTNKLADMLGHLLEPQGQADSLATWAQAQRNRNVYAFLAIIRLFLPTGSVGTPQNQTAFWKHGLSYLVLQLSFSHELQVQIKAEALVTCGDLIRNNAALQEGFAQLMVYPPLEPPAATPAKSNGHPKTYVIDGLLDLTLNLHDQPAFDLRFAACECLKAYFSNHSEVRSHFLGRAIEGFQSGRNESANVLTVLLRPSEETPPNDPYRDWFAAVLTFHLLYENPVAKEMARGLTEGDSSKGEEVVTSIQTITAHLLTRIRRGDDTRILVGYLMLLLGWLFEDPDAVNDLLAEGSNVQSLIQVISQPVHVGGELVRGLCAMLLGFAYEFSTKDSPIPRATLHSVLKSRLDRESYLDRLAQLRSHTLLRDFEVTLQKLTSSATGDQVGVFFDNVFVDFLKDHYSRAVRAIDRKPEMEISVITNGIEKGISRALVDSLRSQVEEKDVVIHDANTANQSLENLLHQEQAAHRHSREEAAAEMARLRSSYDKLQSSHEEELRKLRKQQTGRDSDHEKRIAQMQQQLDAKDQHHQGQLAQARKAAQTEAERIQRHTEAEVADLRATISRLEVDLMKANKTKAHELQALRTEHAGVLTGHSSRMKQSEEKSRELEKQADNARLEMDQVRSEAAQTKTALAAANKSKEETQSELDDLLIVFGDLEEKKAKYKARLRELNQDVSDEEDEDGDGSSGSEDEEDDGDDDGEDDEGVD